MAIKIRSIKYQVTAAVATSAIASACVTLLSFYGYTYYTVRKNLIQDTQSQASVTVKNLEASLIFNDTKDATDTLSALSENPSIKRAIIYKNGAVFAKFPEDLHVQDGLINHKPYYFDKHLETCTSIRLGERDKAELHLSVSLDTLNSRLNLAMLTLLSLSVVSTFIASYLAYRAAKAMITPILVLAETANYVKTTQDYSIRVPESRHSHEVTLLEVSCNNLFEELQRRETHISSQRGLLETLVQERTVELEAAKLKAEFASKTKSSFLANMSHELRTPLTSIMMYSEIVKEDLESGSITQSSIKDVDKVIAASEHLLSLIDDILDLAKVETGKFELYLEDTTLGDLLEEVTSQATVLMEVNDNTFTVHNNATPNLSLYTDGKRVKQILLNLLSNAAKFTHSGSVSLVIQDVDSSILFTVLDTGIGMSEEQAIRVWGEFEQADQATSKKFGGTGLGLSLTKKFTEMLGGSIVLQSTLTVGSSFTVALPLRSAYV